jgi:hypothetical protein
MIDETQFAMRGAAIRLDEIEQEKAQLIAHFQDLDGVSVEHLGDHAFHVRIPPQKARSRRAETAAFLDAVQTLGRVTPQDLRAAGIVKRVPLGVLVRHGYLKRKGDSYVRTAKVYVP